MSQSQSQQRSPSPSAPAQAGPSSAGPAPVVASNTALQQRLADWLQEAAVAAETAVAETEAAVSEAGAAVGEAVGPLPRPNIDGGVVDSLLRVLGPDQLSRLVLDELVVYLDRCLGHYADGMAPDPAPAGGAEAEAERADATGAPDPGGPESGARETAEDGAPVGYANQRDNPPVTVGGATLPSDSQCSATAVTMGLLKLAGGEAAFRDETLALIEERGGPTPKEGTPPEELFIALMLCIDWDAATREEEGRAAEGGAPSVFERHDWRRAWDAAGPRVAKMPQAQTYAARLYTFCGGTGTAAYGDKLSFEVIWERMLADAEAGMQLTFQAGVTGSGHVLHVVSISETDVVVHDPYGVHLGRGHLRNGEKPRPGTPRGTVARRWDNDSARLALFDAGEACGHWGADNHFTRKELKDVGIRWALPLGA